jgi:hypothetical protein
MGDDLQHTKYLLLDDPLYGGNTLHAKRVFVKVFRFHKINLGVFQPRLGLSDRLLSAKVQIFQADLILRIIDHCQTTHNVFNS